ncbi:hypothetical protein AVEN_205906-1 [Araneus ventricosus]|uniref:RNase H type-1 domain-containing protein n=1 Tax=Araneus ventricosus TaxID=182803 RepID=A0A4Y2KXC5_ARAVE|nr:hypothetical protein AVEN_205906-1 [Araneus ventricosus]
MPPTRGVGQSPVMPIKALASTLELMQRPSLRNTGWLRDRSRLGLIRAYVGHPGNEMADFLAMTAITTAGASTHHVSLPRCRVKRKQMEWAMKEGQEQWDLNDVGTSTYEVLPKVSLKPSDWPRELTIFVSGHGLFPVYLKK